MIHPQTKEDIETLVAHALRVVVNSRITIHRYREQLAGIDLQAEPFGMDPTEDAHTKGAINDVDDALQSFTMANVNYCTGFWQST